MANDINSREHLADFIDSLRTDLLTHPEKWENATLEEYLEALAAWVRDMDGLYKNLGVPMPEAPDWRLIMAMLRAGRNYE
jgi:hypothetical protein